MSHARTLTSALLVLLAFTAVLAACGLPEDSEPRAVPDDALPDPLRPVPSTTTTLPPADSETHDVYLVQEREGQDPQVVAVPRQVPRPAGVEDVLAALLERPEQNDSSSTSRIPPDVELISADLEDGTLTVNLSEEMSEIEGTGLKIAVAQIVFTVTEFEEVDQVRFEFEGQPTSVPSGDAGSKQIVTRADYADLDPATQ